MIPMFAKAISAIPSNYSSYVYLLVWLAMPWIMPQDGIQVITKPDRLQPNSSCSYLIVTADKFLADIKPLAKLRKELGHRVSCIAVDSIRPATNVAIKDVIDAWVSPGGYVLLAGDTTAIPCWHLRDYRGRKIISDYPYAQNREQTLHIGRLPVTTSGELRAVIAKIIDYETERRGGYWQRRVSFIAGQGYFGIVADALLENIMQTLLSNYVPPWCELTMSYANPRSPYFFPAQYFPSLVTARLNQGALFFVYIGHGHASSLGTIRTHGQQYPIFDSQHLANLNIARGMPIFISIACHTGSYQYNGLGAQLAKQRRGPVAFIGSSQVSHPYANILLGRALLTAAFSKHCSTIGQLLQSARRQLQHPPAWDVGRLLLDYAIQYFAGELPLEKLRRDHSFLYNLFGDPATRIFYPQFCSSLTVRQQKNTIVVEGKIATNIRASSLVVTLEVPCHQYVKRDNSRSNDSVLTQRMTTYAWANNKILAKKQFLFSGQNFNVRLNFEHSLAPGTYYVKVAIDTSPSLIVAAKIVNLDN